jgi:hypothetical protein
LVLSALVAGFVTAASPPASADVAACLQAAERAQPLRRAGELREARARLIACSSPECPGQVRIDCTRWLTELESAQPTIVVQAKDARGLDVVDVAVSVDGILLRTSLDGLAWPVDPGTRVMRFEAPGRAPVTQTLAIREGERNRVVTVVLVDPSTPARPAALADPQPKRDVHGVEEEHHPIPAISWVLGGVGALAVGGGVVLWASGIAERDALRGQCASGPSCSQRDIDAAKTTLRVGDVLAGVGVLSLGAAVVVALRSLGSSPTTVVLGPTRVGLVHQF